MGYFAPQIGKQARGPDGGIGRRAGLKHQWIHFHPGSTPGLGTEAEKVEKLSPLFFSTPVTRWFADRLNQELYCKNWFDMFFRQIRFFRETSNLLA